MEWLYLVPAAFRKGLIAIGQGLVFVGHGIVQAVKWANESLPSRKNGDKDLTEYYQNLVNHLNVTVNNLSLDLQRQRESSLDFEYKMNAKVDQLEKEVEQCKADRNLLRNEAETMRNEVDTIKKLKPNSSETVGGK